MKKKKNNLSLPVLVLNKFWFPISIVSVRRSILETTSGRAKFLETANNELYDFNSWANLPLLIEDEFISSVKLKINIPEIIVATHYEGVPIRDVKLTTKNLSLRDGYRCQYTNKKLSEDEITIDHIIPKSRGGKKSWTNLVITSFSLNSRKGNRTPEEAGLKLIKDPVKPAWSPIYSRFSKLSNFEVPESWKPFIKKHD